MKKLIIPMAIIVSLCVLFQIAIAQTPEMPVPQLVVKDADGKVVARIAGWDGSVALVILNIAGIPALFEANRNGLQDHNTGSERTGNLFYSLPDCTGEEVYMNVPDEGALEHFTGVNFAVYGPDPTSGEYVVYRSEVITPLSIEYRSEWLDQTCRNVPPDQYKYSQPALEVVPNPLAGFHGRTGLQTERYWTVSGGDKLP